jgi:uncharacterized protein involved in exopolysaccharide biosynthesis
MGSFGGLGLGRARQQATAREFLTTVFRDWRLMVAVFATVSILFLLAGLFIRTTYTAQSRLLVLFSKQYSAQGDVGEAATFLPDQSQIVRNEMELLTSPLLVEQVLDDLGIDVVYPDMVRTSLLQDLKRFLAEQWASVRQALHIPQASRGRLTDERVLMNRAVQRFLNDLTVTPVKDANILMVAFNHPDPELAAGVVNTTVNHYLEERSKIFTQDKTKQLTTERNRYADRLAAADEEIEQFKLTNHISAFEDEKSLLLRQQAETRNDRNNSATRLDEAQARVGELENALHQVPKDIPLYSEKGTVDAGDNMRAALLTLKLRRSELLTKFVANSRYITDLDQQIADLEAQLAKAPEKSQDAVRTGRNAVYDNLQADMLRQQADVESLKSRIESLNSQLKELDARLAEFDRLERTYNSLTLNRALVEQNLKTYSQRLEEAQILENMERSKSANVRVIETAEPPSVGSGTRRLVVAMGLAIGLIAAIAMIFLLDATREMLITPEAVSRQLRLPVLISIAHKNPPQPRDWNVMMQDVRKVVERIAGMIRAEA